MANEFTIDGIAVPFATTYQLTDELEYKKNTSLEGVDTYDFLYRKRKWQISWDYIKTESDFALVKQFWLDMVTSGDLPLMSVVDEGISSVPVFIDISVLNRQLRNTLQQGFTITVSEALPV